MKKTIKKINFFLIILSLVIPFFYTNASTVEFINEKEKGLKEYLGENYKERIIKNSTSANTITEIESLINKTSLENSFGKSYPNYLGGLYINNSDEVVIQIVKNKIPNKLTAKEEYNLYSNIISLDKSSKIEYVDYSYNEINEVMRILESYYTANYYTGNIEAFYDDITNNRIVVELKKYSQDEINKFKRDIIDSDLIYFIESKEYTEYLTSYFPGQGILSLGCSVGFRAKLGNSIGFVTAGHCVSEIGQEIPLYGSVEKRKFSGKIDASWISLYPQYTVVNSLKFHAGTGVSTIPLNNSPVTKFVVGELYGKSGMSSKYTYGKITSLSSNMNGITGMVGTNIYATNGDSGGVVFKILGTGAKPTAYITSGIVHGGPSGGGNMSFVRAQDIVSSFGLTTY